MEMELTVALILLATAVIGLVGALAGKKQVTIIHQGLETAEFPQQPNTATPQERATETVTPPSDIPPLPSTEPAMLEPEQLHWYDKTVWLVLSFILFWPVGLYGIAKSRAVKRGWKIATFVIFGILMLISALEP